MGPTTTGELICLSCLEDSAIFGRRVIDWHTEQSAHWMIVPALRAHMVVVLLAISDVTTSVESLESVGIMAVLYDWHW